MAVTEVLLLGTFHMSNPGLDFVNPEIDDVLSDARQQEIGEVVSTLASFRPTVVAVEWPAERQADLDALFAQFLDGEPAGRSEVAQLGFPVARRAGLDHLLAIDVMDDFWVPRIDELAETDADVARRLSELMEAAKEEGARAQEAFQHSTIGELLRKENTDAARRAALTPYLNMIVPIATKGDYPGAEAAANWYRRNFKITANLQAKLSPGDRALVIYGSGHIPVLEHTLSVADDLVCVDAGQYLPTPRLAR